MDPRFRLFHDIDLNSAKRIAIVGSTFALITIAFLAIFNLKFSFAQTTLTEITTISTTVDLTSTVINWINPSIVDIQYWLIPFVFILTPVGLFLGITLGLMKGEFFTDVIIFMSLLGLIVGSIMGLLVSITPFWLTIVFVAVLTIYIYRR